MGNGKVRLLIADDEPHIRQLIGEIFSSLGAEVVAQAADGAQAVSLFEQTRPDMVVLDINMPKMTGDRALERILEIEPRVVGIMMTSQDSIATVRDCLEIGAAAYILKSNPAPEILRLIQESWPEYLARINAGAAH